MKYQILSILLIAVSLSAMSQPMASAGGKPPTAMAVRSEYRPAYEGNLAKASESFNSYSQAINLLLLQTDAITAMEKKFRDKQATIDQLRMELLKRIKLSEKVLEEKAKLDIELKKVRGTNGILKDSLVIMLSFTKSLQAQYESLDKEMNQLKHDNENLRGERETIERLIRESTKHTFKNCIRFFDQNFTDLVNGKPDKCMQKIRVQMDTFYCPKFLIDSAIVAEIEVKLKYNNGKFLVENKALHVEDAGDFVKMYGAVEFKETKQLNNLSGGAIVNVSNIMSFTLYRTIKLEKPCSKRKRRCGIICFFKKVFR
jgi:cell division protein FtsB